MNPSRVFNWNNRKVNSEGDYVLYWMQIIRRFEYNYALEFAVQKANELNKPLLIFEGLKCTYPWASDRFHTFILEGMLENHQFAVENNCNYFSYVEEKPYEGSGLIKHLTSKACLLVTDEFPVFVIRDHNEEIGPNASIPYVSVDSNGIIPLGLSKKAPYSAFQFRRLMQKNFVHEFNQLPARNPMRVLKNRKKLNLSDVMKRWPDRSHKFQSIPKLIQSIPIDHSVETVPFEGTRKAALKRLKLFLRKNLEKYNELRNHPDLQVTSGLSPYLHFGKISAYEVVKNVLNQQPENWSLRRVHNTNGSRDGFFNGHPSIDSFLDEFITWRETGYHFCRHVQNYDAYESLPDWAKRTLKKHSKDSREHIYTLHEFENGLTHDRLWNAAQKQLLKEGTIHNYLRMLWGKKILEWTPDPQTALNYLIHLNNKYSIDGRNPNSYSGIFWILGRFDRPWAPEREIFGSVRYMSSENTARKVKIKKYLEKYS
jgi:deoxyribodipyrimidine photo-lyase